MAKKYAYEYSDFTDTILDALSIDVPEEDYDDPSAQADLALAAIGRLEERARRATEIINGLCQWAQHTGGWEAPIWREAEKFLKPVKKRRVSAKESSAMNERGKIGQ